MELIRALADVTRAAVKPRLPNGGRLRVTVAPGLMGVRMEERPALVER